VIKEATVHIARTMDERIKDLQALKTTRFKGEIRFPLIADKPIVTTAIDEFIKKCEVIYAKKSPIPIINFNDYLEYRIKYFIKNGMLDPNARGFRFGKKK